MRSQARRLSFTLTELLVVIAVIGTLAAILLPALSGANVVSKRTACQSQLRQLGIAFASYTADANGALLWSWDINKDYYYSTNCPTGYFQTGTTTITGNGWPASASSGFPYNSAEFGYFLYPYLNKDAVFTCPIQLQLQSKLGTLQPQSRYVSVGSYGGLVYNHYRQNPYFGHNGWSVGNRDEFGGTNANSGTYPISGQLNLMRKPESTVLHFDVSPSGFNNSYVASPECANSVGGYIAGTDPTLPTSYSSANYCPNIGFIHGTAGSSTRYVGNFSYVDGHVGTLTSDILTDTTDYVFLLKK